MSWKDEIGKYISWEDGKPVVVEFTHGEPRSTIREFKGQKRDAKEWDVTVGGVPKVLQVSAFGFLKQLATIDDLTAQPIRITRTGEGTETKYKVEMQTKLSRKK